METSEYDAALNQALEHALTFLRTSPDRPVHEMAARDELHAALGGTLPEAGTDTRAVLDELAAGAVPGVLVTGSPRFFGFVIGGSHPVALAADWLTSTWDQNAGMYSVSPVAAVVENIVAGWLTALFDLPEDCSVGFVTGGQMATWTCLAAARHQVLADVGWDVETQGLHGAPPVNIVVGAERHGTVDRAVRFLGLGSERSTQVDVDDQGRLDPHQLDTVLDGLDGPTIVVGQAGNVNTGSFDPFEQLVASAHARGAWVHIDGAFGLWARASSRRSHLADGVELADSWSVDAHKWLNVPYDSGVAITRHASAHRATMGHTAAYLVPDEDDRHDPINWNPEHSRRARGIAIWAVLRALGRSGVERLVDDLCDRAVQFAESLGAVEGVEVLNDVVLNQVLVRFTGADDPDEHTRRVIERIQDDGTCWMSGTTWQGMAAMRISVSNWATSPADVQRSVEAVVRCSRG